MPHGRGYGLRPDKFDPRDHLFSVATPDGMVMPDSHALSPIIPFRMDQGPYNSCTAHGSIAPLRFNRINAGLPDIPLSRAKLYWDAGVAEGDTSDIGRRIQDVVKVLSLTGACPEDLWGYDKINTPPPAELVPEAAQHTILEYQRLYLPGEDGMRRALNTAIWMGKPPIIGIPVYKQFESDEAAATGIIRMPKFGDTEVGWHCMWQTDYGPDRAMNWWGDWWGLPELKSFCQFPDEYLPKLAQDCWTVFINK